MKELKVFASHRIRAVMAELVPQFERSGGLGKTAAIRIRGASSVLGRARNTR